MFRNLRGNKSCEGPRHVIVVDTETTREPVLGVESESREVLRLGVARYMRFERGKLSSEVGYAFRSQAQWWDWLAKRAVPDATNWVFAHGAGFDLRVLGWGKEVDSGRLSLTAIQTERRRRTRTAPAGPGRPGLLVLDSPPTIVDCWQQNGAKIRLVDSRNWWNCKLAEIGDELGLPKLEAPDPWESEEAWLTYCARDCEILAAAVEQLLAWHRENDLGVFKPTAAGQSMQAFRHRFAGHKIVLSDCPEIDAYEREAYYAGRLACFYAGHIDDERPGWSGNPSYDYSELAPRPTGVVYHLDVTGLFPSVMRGNLFPWRLVPWLPAEAREPSYVSIHGASLIACLRLRDLRACLPVRCRGRVEFARGSLTTTLAGPELSMYVGQGNISQVLCLARYELAELFTNYVDFFWQLRYMAKLSGRQVEAQLDKLMLNSLYGKFGQRAWEWQDCPDRVAPEAWSSWIEINRELNRVEEFRSIGESVQRRRSRGHHPQSFTAIAAFVTSYARVRMDLLREIAGWHNCYYQGVDSLYVSRVGLNRLQAAREIADQEIGKLRLVGESRKTIFRGQGYYCFGGQWTRTSIRRGAREIAIGSYEQDQFESLDRSCSRPPADGVKVTRVVRTIDPDRPVGETTANGWVRPVRGEQCTSQQSDQDADYAFIRSCSGESC